MKFLNNIQAKAKASLIALLLLALPLVGIVHAQSASVLLEGNTQSLNVTAGETEYSNETSAMVDEVVQVQVWLHNRLMPDAEQAENTTVQIGVPNEQGETQVITGTISADNANTVVDDTTLNLSLERARVEYMEGTAKYRYNAGAAEGRAECETGMDYPADDCYETISISDDIVSTGGVNLDEYRGGNLRGCNAHHETVTIQVRVVADVVSVNKFVRHAGQGSDDWTTSTNAKPGDLLEYMIRFRNEGNTRLENVVVADNLPKYHKYIDGSTKLMSGAFPDGTDITSDNLTTGGIDVGNYAVGAVGYVMFQAELAPLAGYEKCNLTYDLRNVGIVKPEGMHEHYNTAQVLVRVDCAEEELQPGQLVCEQLEATHRGDGRYRFTASARTVGNATFNDFVYSFGDGSNDLITDQTTVEHTYAEPGSYTARVTVRGVVDGEATEVSSDACRVNITISEDDEEEPQPRPEQPERPVTLPETGMGGIVALFTLTSTLSAIAHRAVTARRS